MFTPEELARIKGWLREGVTPEEIASRFELSLNGLRGRLSNCGYRIRVVRELEAVERVEVATVPAVV